MIAVFESLVVKNVRIISKIVLKNCNIRQTWIINFHCKLVGYDFWQPQAEVEYKIYQNSLIKNDILFKTWITNTLVMFFFMATDLCWNLLWITGSFTAYFGLFISIRHALNHDEVSRQAHIEKPNRFSGKCHPLYIVIFQSTIKEWIFIPCMHLIEWPIDL